MRGGNGGGALTTGVGAGGGGGGGVGVFSSGNVTVQAGGTVTGGTGGQSANSGAGGGAAAVVLTANGSVVSSGTIVGGAGGQVTLNGGGGGGVGVLLLQGGSITNLAGGTILGGAGGAALRTDRVGTGAEGIKGANISVVNAGTVTGALAGGTAPARPRANAITFTGGINALEIWSTSVITGNVQAFSNADRLILGGATDGSFDLAGIGDTAAYRGFGIFEKAGEGTWTLTGMSTGLTPWTLSGGVLSISADASLGDAAGRLTFSGGTLRLTTDAAMSRGVSLAAAGGTIETAAGTTLTAAGTIGGDGGLTKTGEGTLVLTAANTYAGGTTISSGTLQLGDGGTSGGIVDDVANSGALVFFRSNALTLDGAISGSGVVEQRGTGTTVLTGASTYTGGTTISSGTLQLGDGGATGSIVGDVANSGTLVFNRSSMLAFDGAISGTGAVEQRGTGTTVLTGTSTYTGGTTISAGTLQLGSGGATGSIVGDVANNGTLAFNRSDTVAFDGVISGAGAVEHRGAGVTILTGTSTYTGATTIERGTLALAGAGSIAQSSGVRADGVLDISGTSGGASVRSLSGAGMVDLGARTLALTAAADTFAGVIQGTGGLAVAGGTELLTGNNTYAGPTTIAAGATLQLGAGGMSGSIVGDVTNHGVLARSDAATFAGVISGGGAVHQVGPGTTILTDDSAAFAGRTTVSAGTLSVNGTLGGTMDLIAGRLQGIGTVGTTTSQAGGTIAPGNSIGTLTIAGNHVGSGGVLEIEAQLGGDGSPSDRLVVTGSTAGTTMVRIINVGGTGVQTVAGIKVIDVAGASGGTFTLQGDYVLNGTPVVVAGAYGYALQKNGLGTPDDGDWYLRSALLNPVRPADPPTPLYQAGVPVYESYGQALLGLNGLGTLEQRVGNRIWMPGSDGARTGAGTWGRIDAGYSSIDPDVSTSGTRFNATTWRLQAGVDAVLHDGAAGSLIGGFTVHYTTSATDVGSTYGKGRISTNAYGLGGTLTWHGAGGLYLDGQAQLTWYDSDLTSRTASRNLAKGNGAFGYAFGLEGGHRIALAPSWSLTPQAQLAYSRVSADRFTDPYGARMSLDDADSLHGRVGVALDHQSAWSDPAGQAGRAKLYGIANLHYEFLDGTAAHVSGTRFVSRQQRLWGSLGAGGTLDWANGKYALYGEAAIATSLADFGDSYTVKGTAGFRFRW